MAFTYDEFMRQAQNSGLLEQFSQADLDTAKLHPEFGLSILSLKKDYGKAQTDEERLLINQTANQLRGSYAGYSGGADGSGYVIQEKLPFQINEKLDQVSSYQPFTYDDTKIKEKLDQISGYQPFTYDKEAPTYESAYADLQKKLLDEILNREEFSWSKDEDPLWPVYKKQYLREGERATANALGQAAAASGGRPSSYAVGAATQAGDYYAAQLNDIIPTLYQQAYNKYLQEYGMKLQDLGAVNEQEQQDYAKFLDQLSQFNTDRNFALQGWQSKFGLLQDQLSQLGMDRDRAIQNWQSNFGLLQDQLSALQGQDAVNYGREQDRINLELERSETERQAAVSQVAAILQAGGRPSDELLAKAGLTTEYAQGVNAGWQRENAVKQVADILNAGGLPSDELLAQAGLTAEYAQGVHGQFQREEADEQRDLMRAQVDAILQAGGTPSQEMIAASGYSGEYVQALVAAYQRQQAQAVAAKRTATGNTTRQSGTGGGMDYDGLFAAAKASGRPKSFLSQKDNYQRYGFNSSSGLWDDYQAWEEENEDDGVEAGGANGGGSTSRKFTSYDSAINFLRQQGMNPGTPYTSSEWSTRRSSYKRTGKGDPVLGAYDTYADYITAYVQYCMETKAK